MANNNGISRMTIDLSKENHKKLKAVAALQGKSMRQLVLESIQHHLKCTSINDDKKIV